MQFAFRQPLDREVEEGSRWSNALIAFHSIQQTLARYGVAGELAGRLAKAQQLRQLDLIRGAGIQDVS